MNRNSITKLFFILILPLILFMPSVDAANGWEGSSDGTSTPLTTCSNSPVCYNGIGLRFSLYKYSGSGKAVKQGTSYDIWDSNFPNPNHKSYQGSSVKYTDPRTSDSVNKKNANGTKSNYSKLTLVKGTNFKLTRNDYIKLGSSKIKKFNYDYRDNSELFRTKNLENNQGIIKTEFGTTDKIKNKFKVNLSGDYSQYYLVVEPLYQITNYGIYRSGWKQNFAYVGTVFELSDLWSGFTEYTNSLVNTDTVNKFVTHDDKGLLKTVSKSIPDPKLDGGSSTWGISYDVMGKKTYGMAVYKLSTYINPSCRCAANDYKCAMNYCDKASGENNRLECVTKVCGIEDPGFSACAVQGKKNGSDTTCSSSTSAGNGTCHIANSDNYYKTTCNEQTNVFYNDSLPTSLRPGMGFSYSLLLSGKKDCNTAFEVNKWNFDYAVSNNSDRNVLKKKLTEYQNLNKDSLTSYKYDASKANVTIDIEEKIDNEKNTKSTTKTLKNFSNPTSTDIKISNNNTFKVMTSNTAFNNKRFTSSMSSIYSLPDVCIDGASGKVYDSNNGKCKSDSNGPYTKYFTSLKASMGINNTTVKINKSSSNMNDLTNKCYYKVDDQPLNCIISKENNKYALKVYSEYNIDYTKLRYVLSVDPNSNNWSSAANSNSVLDTVEINEEKAFTLYGKVKYENKDNMVAICSIARPEKTTGDRCTIKYRPTEYDQIAAYCKNNWHTDQDSYISEKACYNACTTLKTCKYKFSCDDPSINNYCETSYKADGYKDVATCINDCSCNSGKAVYRPISLTNPFPNRLAGANWRGYEKTINDGSEKNPEYVVNLSASNIETIKSQSDRYNTTDKNAYLDYIRAKDSDINGKYISKFIHDNDPSNGGFTDYFCIISGKGSCK